MKTIYIECNMGCAGDMLTGALLEICPDRDGYFEAMKALSPYGVEVSAAEMQKCGITGTHMRVSVHGHTETPDAGRIHAGHDRGARCHPDHSHAGGTHHHAHHHGMGYQEVLKAIDSLPLPEKVRADARAVYQIIGEAEAQVHGKALSQIHFHEVGTMDALADVAGCCWLFHAIGAERILASPVHTGQGSVTCAHGILPVPAPATERILRGIPTYADGIEGELCTPTGAALLKYFVQEFCPRPVMTVTRTGYGMGTKDFERANCVRAYLGQTEASREEICELVCNMDDITGEALSYACGVLYENGALEVYTIPVFMKKGRNGVLLSCLCRVGQEDALASCILKHTTTRGVRIRRCERRVLGSRFQTRETPYGSVRVKISEGFGIYREKPEFEDVKRAAQSSGAALDEVLEAVKRAGDDRISK